MIKKFILDTKKYDSKNIKKNVSNSNKIRCMIKMGNKRRQKYKKV
jgi:hypothetical protein